MIGSRLCGWPTSSLGLFDIKSMLSQVCCHDGKKPQPPIKAFSADHGCARDQHRCNYVVLCINCKIAQDASGHVIDKASEPIIECLAQVGHQCMHPLKKGTEVVVGTCCNQIDSIKVGAESVSNLRGQDTSLRRVVELRRKSQGPSPANVQ